MDWLHVSRCWLYPTRNQAGWEIKRFQHLQSVEQFQHSFWNPFLLSQLWCCHLSRTRSISVSVQSWCSPEAISDLIMIFRTFWWKSFPSSMEILENILWRQSRRPVFPPVLPDFPKIKFCLWFSSCQPITWTGLDLQRSSWKMMGIYFSWQTLIIWQW